MRTIRKSSRAVLFFALLLTLFPRAAVAGSPIAVTRFLERIPTAAAGSEQLVFVVSPARDASTASIFVYGRSGGKWKQAAAYEKANVGQKGIAAFDKKTKGDGRLPT